MNSFDPKNFGPASVAIAIVLLSGGTFFVKAKRSNIETPIYHLSTGQNLTYTISYHNTARADFRGLLPSNTTGSAPSSVSSNFVQAVQSSVKGKWVAIVVAQNDQGSVLACHLEQAHISLRAGEQEATEQEEVVRRDLERPLFARINPQGRVLSVRFEKETDSLSQNFARALLGISQFVVRVPSKTEGGSWETTEEDTSGQYTAHYEKGTPSTESQGSSPSINNEGGELFRKTKIRYLPVSRATTSEAPVAQTITPKTNIVAHFDLRSGHLTSLRGSEQQSVSLAGKNVAQSQTTIELKLEAQKSLASKDLEELQALNAQNEKLVRPVALFVAPSASEVRQASRKRTLSQETLGTLLSELAKHQKAGETQNSGLYLKFRALADLHPESCPLMGKLLVVVPPSSLSFRVLSEALSAVDSLQSQDALLFAIQARPNDKEALLRLIPSLGMEKNPSPSAQKVLSEFSSSSRDPAIASTAQLALGNMARSLAQTAPARSMQIVDAILTQLQKAHSPTEVQQLLLTLGNTGSPRALGVLQRYSRSETIALRATAVNSLRFIDSPSAEHLLLTSLSQDDHPEVRLEAAQALGFRPMTDVSFQSQKNVAQRDPNATVRLAALNNLYAARRESLEFRKMIEHLADNDSSPDVRRVAARIKIQNPDIFGEPSSTAKGK